MGSSKCGFGTWTPNGCPKPLNIEALLITELYHPKLSKSFYVQEIGKYFL